VLSNDIERDFRIQKILIIYPCGYIGYTSFAKFPPLYEIGIENYKPVIDNPKEKKEGKKLSEMIETHARLQNNVVCRK
jgi:hypothetical protein